MKTSNNNLRRHVQQIYEQHIKALPVDERLRLLEVIRRDIGKAVGPTHPLYPEQRVKRANRKWQEIAGSVAHSLTGEDAQAWVSRTRQDSDAK